MKVNIALPSFVEAIPPTVLFIPSIGPQSRGGLVSATQPGSGSSFESYDCDSSCLSAKVASVPLYVVVSNLPWLEPDG